MKAQITAEYIIMFILLLSVFIIVSIIMFNSYQQLKYYAEYKQAKNFLDQLMINTNNVWESEENSSKLVFLYFPEFEIDFNKSQIENKIIKLYMPKFGEVYKIADYNLSGRLSNQTNYYYILKNNSKVFVYPATKIQISKSGFYINSTPTQEKLIIKNLGPISLNCTQTFVINNCPFCSYSAIGTSIIGPSGELEGNLSIPSLSAGIYNGNIKINITNNNGYANYSFEIPITIEVR
jgi:hypothetical protein